MQVFCFTSLLFLLRVSALILSIAGFPLYFIIIIIFIAGFRFNFEYCRFSALLHYFIIAGSALILSIAGFLLGFNGGLLQVSALIVLLQVLLLYLILFIIAGFCFNFWVFSILYIFQLYSRFSALPGKAVSCPHVSFIYLLQVFRFKYLQVFSALCFGRFHPIHYLLQTVMPFSV